MKLKILVGTMTSTADYVAQAIQMDCAELVDEIWLWTFPIVLGEGKRLFGDGAHRLGFRLEAIEASTSGVTLARYVSAEPAPPGSFALEESP